jgi:hypothetical protein
MAPLTDTSPEARRVLTECSRRMPDAQKWRLISEAYCFARTLHATGVRHLNPGATAADIRRDWILRHHGDGPWLTHVEDPTMVQPVEHQRVIREVLAAFARIGVTCAVGGSVASSVYTTPRYTQDVDIAAEPFPGREAQFVRQLGPEYYVSLPAVEQAVRDRGSFNVIHTYTAFKADVFILKQRPFDSNLLPRRIAKADMDPAGPPVPVLSPEDVVLLKLEWYRLGGEVANQQWGDITGVLKTQGDRLDAAYLDRWAADLGVADLLVKARAAAAA